MKYINLYTVDNSYEANFIKENLADEGIECMLTNENFTNLMPYLNGMLGSGIQILVDKDDYDRAKQILDNKNSAEIKVCPNCDSTNIKYGLGTKHRLKKICHRAANYSVKYISNSTANNKAESNDFKV